MQMTWDAGAKQKAGILTNARKELAKIGQIFGYVYIGGVPEKSE